MNELSPDVVAVVAVSHGVLRLSFEGRLTAEVDVLPRMHGPVFDEASTPEGFAKAAVDPETGTVV